MKLKILLLAILLVGLVTGCYYDVIKPADPNAPPQQVSYSGDLQPIWTDNCTTSGCHDGAHDPLLTPEDSYNALMSGGFVNTAIPNESTLYQVLSGGSMPPTGKLPSSDIQMVLDWIKNGAPNN
ncbi:MAG TPA: hypothetical protein VFW07_16090 [Parafilimonas sp.]|nr:hypothetical protein [Parafilimonas sp.]